MDRKSAPGTRMTDQTPEFEDLTPEEYRAEVIEELTSLLLKTGALTAGKTKTGPYQLDTGKLSLGTSEFEVGRAFAVTLNRLFAGGVDTLVASNTRAVPFAVMAAQYYGHLANGNVRWCAFCSGDTGPELFGRTATEYNYAVVIGDTMGAGTHQELVEAIEAAKATGMKVLGALVLLDRRDRAKTHKLVSAEILATTGVKVMACASMAEIFKHLQEREKSAEPAPKKD